MNSIDTVIECSSPEVLTNILAGMIYGGESINNLFADRAVMAVSALSPAMVEYYQRGDMVLSLSIIIDMLTLDHFIQIATDESLSHNARLSLVNFLDCLPGCDEIEAASPMEEAVRQMSFVSAYFVHAQQTIKEISSA